MARSAQARKQASENNIEDRFSVAVETPATPQPGVPEEVGRQLTQALGSSFLVFRGKVQEELKLSDEQKQKLQKRLQDDDLVGPLDAHRRDVDGAAGVEGGDDRLNDHDRVRPRACASIARSISRDRQPPRRAA